MYKSIEVLAGVRVSKFRATEAGVNLLEANSELLELVGRFSSSPKEPESHGQKYQAIGEGQHSVVRSVAGVALKMSTRTTGKFAWEYGRDKPENLISHLYFLAALRRHLGSTANNDLVVPEQYFALRTSSGSYMKAEQYVPWQSLRSWSLDYPREQVDEVYAKVKSRVDQSIGRSVLRFG